MAQPVPLSMRGLSRADKVTDLIVSCNWKCIYPDIQLSDAV
jgi:hypothetical protein